MYKPLPIIALAFLTFLTTGCIRREITVDSDPQGALVYLNDKEIGRTPVTVPFTWHGDYDVRLEKKGYQTYVTVLSTEMKAYELPPVDFMMTVLPVDLRNHQYFKITMRRQNYDIDMDQLIERAKALETQLNVPEDKAEENATTQPASTQPAEVAPATQPSTQPKG